MRGGTSASRGPGAVRPVPGRGPAGGCGILRPAKPGDAVVITPAMASGDRAGRPRSYLVRFRRRPAGNSRQTTGGTLFKAKDKQVNVLARKPAGAGSAAVPPCSRHHVWHTRYDASHWRCKGQFVFDTIVMAGGRAGLTRPRSWDVMTIISAYPPSRSLSSEPERTRWLRRRVQGMRRSARGRLP
jgi:hypothetical protein